jgi:hypothetical protein
MPGDYPAPREEAVNWESALQVNDLIDAIRPYPARIPTAGHAPCAGVTTGSHCFRPLAMTKAFSFLIILAMAVQVIRPLGLPGLKKRSDFWKLAIVAFAAVLLVAGLRMGLKGE